MRIGPLGIWELLIILVVVLLIFGPRRLPEMAKGLGQSVREFRKGIRDIRNDFEEGDAKSDAASKSAAPPAQPAAPTEPVRAAPTAPAAEAPAADASASDRSGEEPRAAADDSDDDVKTKASADA